MYSDPGGVGILDMGSFPVSMASTANPEPSPTLITQEVQRFLFPKSLSPKKEGKLLSAGFIWKKSISGTARKKNTPPF